MKSWEVEACSSEETTQFDNSQTVISSEQQQLLTTQDDHTIQKVGAAAWAYVPGLYGSVT